MKKNIRNKALQYALMIILGLVMYLLPYAFWEKGNNIIRIIHKADIVYLLLVLILILNSLLLAFLDYYSNTDKNRDHPLKGLIQGLQVILFFVGGIVIVSVIIDKSPTALLTGLGASAAVLMLVFKDSILGFVAGVQLSQNNMIRIGDWIQMPDGSANGTVEEITLNTVKVRNWDNTLSMIPPYTLVSTPFKNWRGMQESAGRRADKCIFIDITSLSRNSDTTNIQQYRQYIEDYLKQSPLVNQDLDIIVTQKEATAYGLPIEVYFFTKEKSWAAYEKQQSDIFDHIMSMAREFGLRLYQRP